MLSSLFVQPSVVLPSAARTSTMGSCPDAASEQGASLRMEAQPGGGIGPHKLLELPMQVSGDLSVTAVWQARQSWPGSLVAGKTA